jgi:DNA-binding beta-propeller fold protein YncE
MKRFFIILCISAGFTATAQKHELVKKWESDSVFKVPESVLYDPDHQVLYVTNIEGKDPWGKDGLGSIGKIGVDGKVINAEWITGFNAPKGMGLYHHTLYVADIENVVVVDLHQGKIITSIEVPGAEGLNDISIDAAGVIYVSDSKNKKVFRIQNGVATVHLESLKGPNGVLFHKDVLYVLDAGGLYKVNADKSLTMIVDGMEGGTDGIENIGGDDFIVSTWSGVVYHVNTTAGSKQILIDGRAAKINSADIGYNPATKTLYVPTFWKNTVVAYEVK